MKNLKSLKTLKLLPILLFFSYIPSVTAIEKIKCFSDTQRIITSTRRITFPIISLKMCVCTTKGTYCSFDGLPIQDTNVRANCKELGGDEIGKYCGLQSEDRKTIILFEKEKGINK